MKTREWFGLYTGNWNGDIHPTAVSHPAKFSRKLIFKIYEHAIEQGYVKPGDLVGDPFGGVALGARPAIELGLNWIGVELEQHFVDLGQGCDCTGYTAADWPRMQGRGRVFRYLDTRHLCPECVEALDATPPRPNFTLTRRQQARKRRMREIGREKGVVPTHTHPMPLPGSKWYEQIRPKQLSLFGGGREEKPIPSRSPHRFHGNVERWMDEMWAVGRAVLVQGDSRNFAGIVRGVLDAAVGSPPYATDTISRDQRPERPTEANRYYGESFGQLGGMVEGDLDASISSPPFGVQETRDRNEVQDGEVSEFMGRAYTADRQGQTPGNLSQLDVTVGSPPYADAVDGSGEGPGARHDMVHHSPEKMSKKSSAAEYGRREGNLGNMAERVLDAAYGNSNGNVGNESGETFWTAARKIVSQTYQTLKPGGYAIWVTGDYVRDGERVMFGEKWLRLCEAVGFEAVEWIAAWKIDKRPTQTNALGEDVDLTVEQISFFRRLANRRNPDAAIRNEDVIIVRKPLEV